jgi:hypothetical protein
MDTGAKLRQMWLPEAETASYLKYASNSSRSPPGVRIGR